MVVFAIYVFMALLVTFVLTGFGEAKREDSFEVFMVAILWPVVAAAAIVTMIFYGPFALGLEVAKRRKDK